MRGTAGEPLRVLVRTAMPRRARVAEVHADPGIGGRFPVFGISRPRSPVSDVLSVGGSCHTASAWYPSGRGTRAALLPGPARSCRSPVGARTPQARAAKARRWPVRAPFGPVLRSSGERRVGAAGWAPAGRAGAGRPGGRAGGCGPPDRGGVAAGEARCGGGRPVFPGLSPSPAAARTPQVRAARARIRPIRALSGPFLRSSGRRRVGVGEARAAAPFPGRSCGVRPVGPRRRPAASARVGGPRRPIRVGPRRRAAAGTARHRPASACVDGRRRAQRRGTGTRRRPERRGTGARRPGRTARHGMRRRHV